MGRTDRTLSGPVGIVNRKIALFRATVCFAVMKGKWNFER
jgi:hypothetical protein